MDDNSELSESTSGCSSLIPQINRHEDPSNLLYGLFSNRKRHINDKLTYSEYKSYFTQQLKISIFLKDNILM